MKKYAVIVAAGTGSRMGSAVPKQFLLLQGKPVIWHTLNLFLQAYDDLEIILVLPEVHLDKGHEISKSFPFSDRIRLIAGGDTRFHSVKKGLSTIQEPGIVFVHDGVRCLLSKNLVHRCYQEALEFGSAIPVVPCKDSVRLVSNDKKEVIDRDQVRLVQTPQTFLSEILLPAYAIPYQERFTDEAVVVEASGHNIHLVDGELNNIKITTSLDLLIAEELLKTTKQLT